MQSNSSSTPSAQADERRFDGNDIFIISAPRNPELPVEMMTTEIPPTFDRMVADIQTRTKGLIECLHRLESHVDMQTPHAPEADRDCFESVSVRLWQAVGMAEGVLHMVELAERQRPRTLV